MQELVQAPAGGQGLDDASANHGGLVRATESHHPCHLVFVKTPICSLVLRSEANKVELEVLAEDFEAPGVWKARKLYSCTCPPPPALLAHATATPAGEIIQPDLAAKAHAHDLFASFTTKLLSRASRRPSPRPSPRPTSPKQARRSRTPPPARSEKGCLLVWSSACLLI